MRETVTLTGVALISAPSGDCDGRLVLLTGERGWITAFSYGVRKPGNALMAASKSLFFSTFSMYEGRSVYSLQSTQVINYFDKLSMDMECTYYGFYFLEIVGCFPQGNMDGTEALKLLHQSLRAPLKPAIPSRPVGRIPELKTVVTDGECTETPPSLVSESCNYTWEYVVCSPMETLYKLVLKEDMIGEFDGAVGESRRYHVHHEFKFLEILDMFTT